jgi:dTDP-4-dehydrorhamnose 3,5-epimerase
MKFTDTPIPGARLIEPEPRRDDRGFFARLWCREEFAAHGLSADFVQCNDSFSRDRGTLRGLHYQSEPHGEAKLVSCVRGRVFDVIVDLRPASAGYRQWFGAELTAENRLMVYVPAGCAHGYLTLEDASEVVYPVTAPYHPASERGLRWNDPAVGIAWPMEPLVISPKDREWPDLV